MTLVGTSALNALATLVRILTAIGLNKVLAVYVGPAGYAMVGQFANVVSLSTSVTSGAVVTGVTKYTAEHAISEERQRAIWRAAGAYVLAASLVAATLFVVLRAPLAAWLLDDETHAGVFLALAVALPFGAFNALLLAVMNGRKEVRRYVFQNIGASLLGAGVAAILAATHGITGALVALAINQALAIGLTLFLCRRATWLSLEAFVGRFDRDAMRALLGFALMTLTSSLVAPLSQLMVREHLVETFGAGAAGEWQAVFKISELYLTLFTSTLTVYYLPRLAELQGAEAIRSEIRRLYRFALPLAMLAAAILYVLRAWVTRALFTEEFLGMVHLFGWQLVGDVLKIGSWVLGFVLIGRALVRWFILTELVFSSSWVLLTYLLTHAFGLTGAPAAFAANYGLYWLFMAWLIRRVLTKLPS